MKRVIRGNGEWVKLGNELSGGRCELSRKGQILRVFRYARISPSQQTRETGHFEAWVHVRPKRPETSFRSFLFWTPVCVTLFQDVCIRAILVNKPDKGRVLSNTWIFKKWLNNLNFWSFLDLPYRSRDCRNRKLLTAGNYQKTPPTSFLWVQREKKNKNMEAWALSGNEQFFLGNLETRFISPQSGCQPAFLLDSSS